jgi:hypothetical protein
MPLPLFDANSSNPLEASIARLRNEKHSCMCCDKQINAKHTICAACAEDMGYARRAR